MYNEKVKVVSLFKDYLIWDDMTEFLKRSYTYPEGIIRLSKIFEFYDAYSQVFPNYIRLPERKQMYKNIERKQKLIEAQNETNGESSVINDTDQNDILNMSKNKLGLVNQILFNSQFMNSIMKIQKQQYDKMDLEGL